MGACIFTTVEVSINFFGIQALQAFRHLTLPRGGAFCSITMQLTSEGGSDSEDSESEDSDEADNRKMRMFDDMTIQQVDRMKHPDFVAKIPALNERVKEVERHQNYVCWSASEDPVVQTDAVPNHQNYGKWNDIPVVSANALKAHLRAFHGFPEEAPQKDIYSNEFSDEGAEESQPLTKYNACQHEHAKLQYDNEIQSTTIAMWEEYEEWEKAVENQRLKEMFAQANKEDGSQTLTAVQYYMRLDDYNANMEKYQQEWEADLATRTVARAKAKPEAKRINCANGGCPRRALDLCFQCGAPHCEAHLALCNACRRGTFCDICVIPLNHTCMPVRPPPEPEEGQSATLSNEGRPWQEGVLDYILGSSKQARKDLKSKMEQEEAEWRRRHNAQGTTLCMEDASIKNAAKAGIRCPVISGKRGARPFLFQTKRGLQIVQDSLDESASSDNEPIEKMAGKVRLRQDYEHKQDSDPIAKVMMDDEKDQRPLKAPCRKAEGEPHKLFGANDTRAL